MLINPLSMTGPHFLAFYMVVGISVLFLINTRIKKEEMRRAIPQLNLNSPYEIAMLRGGEEEAITVAVASLIDRGFLVVSDEMLETKNETTIEHATSPLERAILKSFITPGGIEKIYQETAVKTACLPYLN